MILEKMPLCVLVSLLYSDTYLNYTHLVSASYDPSKPENTGRTLQWLGNEIPAPRYSTYDSMYEEIEAAINGTPELRLIYEKVLTGVQAGEIKTYLPKTDQYGENYESKEPLTVYSWSLLIWAERNGIPLPVWLHPDLERLAQMHYMTEQADQTRKYKFPDITVQIFAEKAREPLWRVCDAIMYIHGKRIRASTEDGYGYIKYDDAMKTLMGYIRDAQIAGVLPLHEFVPDIIQPETILSAKVEPGKFIAWVKTLPTVPPMINSDGIAAGPTTQKHVTPDMKLMYSAIEKFWGNYDLANPDPDKAPLKKEVTEWLQAEAKKQNISPFSAARASAIDTLIRCPESRKGGNST